MKKGTTRPDSPLAQLRLRQGLTQADLAKKIGATRQRIYALESGREKAGRRNIVRLAAALEIGEGELAKLLF